MLQLLWSAVLMGHMMCTAVMWWMAPGGFPSSTPEFWVNQLLPMIPIALLGLGLLSRGKTAEALLPPVFAVFPAFWMSFAISLRLTFPISIGSGWNIPFIGGFALAMLWGWQYARRITHVLLLPLFIGPAIWLGWALPPTQRALDPATHPLGSALADVPTTKSEPKLIKLSKDAQLHSDDGRLVVRRGALVLTVQPLLAFADRAPDRASIDPANKEERAPTVRHLLAFVRDGARWTLHYKDEDRSILEALAHDSTIELDARSRLAAPFYSHANSYAEVTIRGQTKLSIAFSPLGQKRIELAPFGTPTRFAYVDEAGVFHVAQASKESHGPYTELASGPLPKDGALELTLYDGEDAVYKLALLDWAHQASVQRSPVAGWDVPENAIELVRTAEPENSPALVSFSLASTRIGRGTRSVGHTEGVYRNRMSVTVLPPR